MAVVVGANAEAAATTQKSLAGPIQRLYGKPGSSRREARFAEDAVVAHWASVLRYNVCMAAKSPIERALTKLQAAIREAPGDDDHFPGRSGKVPKDLQTDEVKMLAITARDEALRKAAAALLLADERFEHLKQRGADDATWRFICLAFLERSTNHVPTFMREHAQEPGHHTLYIPIESLEVSEEQLLGTVRLLAVDDPEVANGKLGFPLAPPIGAVIAAPVTGTDAGRMIDRGRAAAEHALRVLRVGLREHREIVDRQLRFRLSHLLAFGEGMPGFRIQPDAAWNLPLGAKTSASSSTSRSPGSRCRRPTSWSARRGWLSNGWSAPCWPPIAPWSSCSGSQQSRRCSATSRRA